MRGLRGTLVLAAVVAALALALHFSGREGDGGAELTEPALDGRRLLSAERIGIRSQRDVQPFELRRGPGYGFELTEPLRDLASSARLQAVASAWDQGLLARVFTADELTPDLLAQTGLDAPRGELVAEFEDGRVRVEIGEEGPLGRDVYVRKNGAAHLAPLALYTVLAGTVDDFRARTVFLTTSDDLHRLTVVRRPRDGQESRLVLRRVRQGRYELEEPLVARAHLAGAESFAGSVLGLTIPSFLSGNFAPQPLPDFAIEVEGRFGRETVQLWRQEDGSYIGFQEPRQVAFTMTAADYALMLDVPAEVLRSKLLISVAPDDIAWMKLDPGAGRGRAAVLRRGAERLFELDEPVRARANPTTVSRLLDGLRELSAVEFVGDGSGDLARFGLAEGYAVVEVRGSLERVPVIVHLGREEGELCYARRADETQVVRIPVKSARALRTPWAEFVDLEVYRTAAANIVAVRCSDAGGTRRFERGEDGAWVAGEAGVDGAAVATAVETLTRLVARRVLAPAEAGELGEPATIELLGQGDLLYQQMSLFGAGDRALLRVPGKDVVYELRAGDTAALRALLR